MARISFLFLLAFVPLVSFSQAKESKKKPSVQATINHDWSDAITFPEEQNWTTFLLEADASTAAIQITLLGATGNGDFHLRQDQPMTNWTEADFSSISPDSNEQLLLRASQFENGLEGNWYLDVLDHSTSNPQLQLEVEFLSTAELLLLDASSPQKQSHTDSVKEEIEAILETSTSVPLYFDEETSSTTFALLVDNQVEEISLHLNGNNIPTDVDLDLYARFNDISSDGIGAHACSTALKAEESIILSRSSTPSLLPGVWYVTVTQWSGEPVEAELNILFQRQEQPSPILSTPVEDELVLAHLHEQGTYHIPFHPGEEVQQLAFDLPEGAESLRISTSGEHRDIDLWLYKDQPWSEDELGQSEHFLSSDLSSDGEELIFLDQHSNPEITAGRYYIVLQNLDYESDIAAVPVHLAWDVAPTDPIAITANQLSHHAIPVGQDEIQFVVDVPEGAETLRFAALNATRDIDLLVHAGNYASMHSEELYDEMSITNRCSEWIEIEAEPGETLAAGKWYINVISLLPKDMLIEFDLITTVDKELDFPPPPALPLPTQRNLTPLEQALQSVVRLDMESGSGSGTLVSPQGHILTNWHVIFNYDIGVLEEEDFFISLNNPNNFDLPPTQLFKAVLIDYDRKLDIALIQITTDIYDQPLPENYRFPYVAFADSNTTPIGTPLFVTGFPATGGQENRPSITMTSGVVGGFNLDETGSRATLKTDARINSGNSGGAILLADGSYLATPHSELVEEGDEIGFANPTRTLPSHWLEILTAAGAEFPWQMDLNPEEQD